MSENLDENFEAELRTGRPLWPETEHETALRDACEAVEAYAELVRQREQLSAEAQAIVEDNS